MAWGFIENKLVINLPFAKVPFLSKLRYPINLTGNGIKQCIKLV
jgi:hypothetical protein